MGRMNRLAAPLSLALLAMVLAGCGSGNDGEAPTIRVTELAAGAYGVSTAAGTGAAADPVEGKYYAAADGSRLLVLNGPDQQASALYRRDAGGGWQASPAVTAGTALDLSGSNAIGARVLDVASVAGRYVVRLAGGATAALAVNPGGDILAGDTACKLTGKVAATTLPNALKLTLAASGCGDLPAQADGYLVVDADYAPAAFRLLAAGGKGPVDLWAYAE